MGDDKPLVLWVREEDELESPFSRTFSRWFFVIRSLLVLLRLVSVLLILKFEFDNNEFGSLV